MRKTCSHVSFRHELSIPPYTAISTAVAENYPRERNLDVYFQKALHYFSLPWNINLYANKKEIKVCRKKNRSFYLPLARLTTPTESLFSRLLHSLILSAFETSKWLLGQNENR